MTNDVAIKPLTAHIHNIVRGAGGGGGGSARAPIEAPDSLRSIAYARILDLIGEGEIYGFADQANPLSCVYLNETPVANGDGSLNFKNIQIDSRVGTQTQDYIKGFGGVENEIAVGVELRADTPYTRTVNNLNLSAVRVRLSVPALVQTSTTTGDAKGYTVAYAIDLKVDGGSFLEVFAGAFTGKASSKYERTHRIDLPPATTNWQLRVRRITADTSAANIQDTTIVESVAEIIDAKFRLPMSAVVGLVVDAEQFNNIPARAYDVKGRLVRVPSNYNPATRVYTGIWDGTFQIAWSDNPAWAFYDMALHQRYGLGHLLTPAMVNKWNLYRIAQYCDGLVDDGFGGQEPRFTINCVLETLEDATRVMMNLATVFRGIMYAAGGELVAVADMPDDPKYLYTPSNVIEGRFTYAATGRKVRHTVALVSWSDQNDFGRQKVEYIEDEDGIARYGIQQTEIIAFGCTSQGQARRLGKYALTTARYETDGVSFGVGLDGTLCPPGTIVSISDPLRAGRRTGGRSRATTVNSVTVDSVPIGSPGDSLVAVLPTGKLEVRPISTIVGNVFTVSPAFSQAPTVGGVWAIESTELSLQRFRVLSVVESTDEKRVGHEVTAIQHVEGKFAFVEDGIIIDEPPISDIPSSVVPAPTGIGITQRSVADENTTALVVNLYWTKVPTAVNYLVKWRQGEGNWIDLGISTAVSLDIPNVLPGPFEVQIVAVNALGVKSIPAFGGPFDITPNIVPPGYVDDFAAADAALLGGLATVEANAALALANETAARTAADAAEALARSNALIAEGSARTAAILVETNARTAADSAEATSRTNLATQLRGGYTGNVLSSVSTGLIASERDARVTADSAITSDITALDARLDLAELGVSAGATAISALDARVVVVEGTVVSNASSIVDLRAGINTATSNPNIVPNPSWEVDTTGWATGGTGGSWTRNTPDANGAYTTFAAPGVGNSRLAYTDVAVNTIASYTVSADLYTTVATGTFGLQLQFYNSSNVLLLNGTPVNATGPLNAWRRYAATETAPAGTAYIRILITANGSTGNNYARRVKLERAPGATPYNTDGVVGGSARALNALDARVTTAEGNITSQASSITSLTSSIAGKADVTALVALTTRVTGVEDNGLPGGNLLTNSNFSTDIAGWTTANNGGTWLGGRDYPNNTWAPPGMHSISSYIAAASTNFQDRSQVVPAVAGKRYGFSAWVGTHRGAVQLFVQFLNAAGTVVGTLTSTSLNLGAAGQSIAANAALDAWTRLATPFGVAPAGTVRARCIFRTTGLGSASGTYGWMVRPLFEEVTASQTVVGPYSTGGVEMFASWSVTLDAAGYVTGVSLATDGTTSAFNVRADLFSLVSPAGGARIEMSSGNIRVYDAANTLRVRMGVW